MPRTPTTQALNISTTRSQLSQFVNRVFSHETRVIIEKSGIPVAALVSAEDAARLVEFERQRQEDVAAPGQIQQRSDDVPADEHEREVARAVRHARARLRGKRDTCRPCRSRMIRAVLDTSVLASGVTHTKGPSGIRSSARDHYP